MLTPAYTPTYCLFLSLSRSLCPLFMNIEPMLKSIVGTVDFGVTVMNKVWNDLECKSFCGAKLTEKSRTRGCNLDISVLMFSLQFVKITL